MRNARLKKHKLESRNINNLRYADDTALTVENKEELKSLLIKVKKESKKLAYNSTLKKLRSWLPVPSLHGKYIGKKMETVTDFIFLGSKITVDGDCSHEIKRSLLLGRKAMINLDSVLKSRDITLSTKIHIVKAMVFPVVI